MNRVWHKPLIYVAPLSLSVMLARPSEYKPGCVAFIWMWLLFTDKQRTSYQLLCRQHQHCLSLLGPQCGEILLIRAKVIEPHNDSLHLHLAETSLWREGCLFVCIISAQSSKRRPLSVVYKTCDCLHDMACLYHSESSQSWNWITAPHWLPLVVCQFLI